MSRKDWIWMPHPGHLCVSEKCLFSLNTYINGYIVSTVGEYKPNEKSKKYEQIGWDRIYETMVFKAKKGETQCCPFTADIEGGEIDMKGYNCADTAMKGHYIMCEKYDLEEQ